MEAGPPQIGSYLYMRRQLRETRIKSMIDHTFNSRIPRSRTAVGGGHRLCCGRVCGSHPPLITEHGTRGAMPASNQRDTNVNGELGS